MQRILFKIFSIVKPLVFYFIRIIYKDHYYVAEKNLNKTVLLVCNGPSLNKVNLEKFKKIHSYGLNKIHLIYHRTTWRPTSIVVSNGLVIRQLKRIIKQNPDKYILDEKSKLFLKHSAKIFKSNTNTFQENYDSDFITLGASVSVCALQIILKSKPKNVIIVGLDHNFKLPNSQNPNKIEIHQGNDENHFSKDYFKDKYWGVPDLKNENYQLKCLKELADSLNINIVDATIGGNLNVFPKINIEEAYKMVETS